jgi:hypothetical protein
MMYHFSYNQNLAQTFVIIYFFPFQLTVSYEVPRILAPLATVSIRTSI